MGTAGRAADARAPTHVTAFDVAAARRARSVPNLPKVNSSAFTRISR
jgi:hypothetical protein